MDVEATKRKLVHDVIGRVQTKPMNGKPLECLADETGIRHERGDIYLVTYPKTGTTLLQYICHLLRTNGDDDDFEDIHQVVPHTSSSWFIGQDLNGKQRGKVRLFKSHRILDQVAPFANGVKYIVTIRDPVKTLISLHSFRMSRGQKQSSDIIEFARSDVWTKENNPGCVLSLLDHYLQFWQAKDCENILIVPYEDLVTHRSDWLRVIALFMGIDDVSDLLLQKVQKKTSRENMLLNVSKLDESWAAKQRDSLGRVHKTIGTKSAAKVNTETAHSFLPPSALLSEENTAKSRVEVEDQLAEMQQRLWNEKILPMTGLMNYDEMRRRIVMNHFPQGYEG